MNHKKGTPRIDRRRTCRIYLRVSADELERIRSRACRAGLGVSAYMRTAALHNPKSCTVVEVDADGLRKAYADLKHAGLNINQCARALNTYGPDALPASAVAGTAQRVADAADAISSVLAAVRGKDGAR